MGDQCPALGLEARTALEGLPLHDEEIRDYLTPPDDSEELQIWTEAIACDLSQIPDRRASQLLYEIQSMGSGFSFYAYQIRQWMPAKKARILADTKGIELVHFTLSKSILEFLPRLTKEAIFIAMKMNKGSQIPIDYEGVPVVLIKNGGMAIPSDKRGSPDELLVCLDLTLESKKDLMSREIGLSHKYQGKAVDNYLNFLEEDPVTSNVYRDIKNLILIAHEDNPVENRVRAIEILHTILANIDVPTVLADEIGNELLRIAIEETARFDYPDSDFSSYIFRIQDSLADALRLVLEAANFENIKSRLNNLKDQLNFILPPWNSGSLQLIVENYELFLHISPGSLTNP